VPGPWYARLPHFELAFTPSNGDELQSEYLVPRVHAPAAIEAVRALAPRIAHLVQVTELRTMAADELWLSPAQGAATSGIHVTWVPDQPAVEEALPALEAALAPFAARPHWGKLFTVDTLRERLPELYPRWHDFRALRAELDPRGAFANPYLAALGL
jgi:xylitol oxidase